MEATSSVTVSPPHRRILIVEDGKKMADALLAGIGGAGYNVTAFQTGEEDFFLVHSFRPELHLLDLNLPQRNGREILREIRAWPLDLRVLVLTSHNSVEDRVAVLEADADDYLGKPFSYPELLARIGALLRRGQVPLPIAALRVADLTFDTSTRIASRAEVLLDLTPREFDLLLYLAENRNCTVSREMLAKNVWKENSRFTPIDNVIYVQMARLRRKVDDGFDVKLLHTIRGVGFSLREPNP